MTISYQFHDTLIHAHVTGSVTPDDVARYVENISVKEDTPTGYLMLMEVEEAKPEGFTAGSLRQIGNLAKLYGDRMENSASAIVAPTPLLYGMVRTYTGIRSHPSHFRPFRGRADAVSWLVAQTSNDSLKLTIEGLPSYMS